MIRSCEGFDSITVQPGAVALLGIPWDENSSYMRGCASAPARVRELMAAGASNLCAENGTDLEHHPDFFDAGDLTITSGEEALAEIERGVTSLLAKGIYPLCLGGDHAVSYPVVKAVAAFYPRLTLLHFDAHPDLYEEYEGNRYSHACPFARIMEAGLVERLVQVGIRTLNPHQRAQAERFGVEILTMRDWQAGRQPGELGRCYLSLDLDVLDPAFAPGVSHHEPGGMSVRELLGTIQGLNGRLIGADIVEYNPARDPSGVTGAVAVKILKEIASVLLRKP